MESDNTLHEYIRLSSNLNFGRTDNKFSVYATKYEQDKYFSSLSIGQYTKDSVMYSNDNKLFLAKVKSLCSRKLKLINDSVPLYILGKLRYKLNSFSIDMGYLDLIVVLTLDSSNEFGVCTVPNILELSKGTDKVIRNNLFTVSMDNMLSFYDVPSLVAESFIESQSFRDSLLFPVIAMFTRESKSNKIDISINSKFQATNLGYCDFYHNDSLSKKNFIRSIDDIFSFEGSLM